MIYIVSLDVFASVSSVNQRSREQEMRQTLQKAQEITQVISEDGGSCPCERLAEAESIADDATKFCDAIQDSF